MRLLRYTLLALAVLALWAGAAGAKGTSNHGPRPDRSFGNGGGGYTVSAPRVLGLIRPPRVRLAVAPNNKSYIQVETRLLAFRADGRPDGGFGDHGEVIVASHGGAVLDVADVAVDSHGRVLVAGSFEPVPGLELNVVKGSRGAEFKPYGPVTEVFVERYLPDGSPDPSFGVGGEIDTTLASPRPVGTVASPAEYERPSVEAQHLGVDAEDRPVIAAEFVQRVETCFDRTTVDQTVVARLNEDGSPDPSFGNGGVETVGSQTPIGLAAAPGDGWAVLSGPEVCEHGTNGVPTELSVLTASGSQVATLDPARPKFPAAEEVFAVDGSGRALYTEADEVGGLVPRLYRLLANGDPDPSFGHGGVIGLKNQGAERIVGLAVDSKGRIVAGIRSGSSAQLEVVRLSSKGKIDGRFGRHGVLRSNLASPSFTEAVAIDSKGRIIVAGPSEGESSRTVSIARFLPNG